MDYANLEKLLDKDAVDAFRKRGLNPDNPVIRGTAQNPDIYFQTREAVNTYYNALPEIVENYMGEISKLTGREYHLFNYYGAEDAEDIIIIMGSASETVRTVVEKLNAEGKKGWRTRSSPVSSVQHRALHGRNSAKRKTHRCTGPHQRAGRFRRTSVS